MPGLAASAASRTIFASVASTNHRQTGASPPSGSRMLTMPPSLFSSAKTGMPLSFSVISSGVSAVGAAEGAAGGAGSSAPPRRLSTKGSSRGRERSCSEGAVVASATATIESIGACMCSELAHVTELESDDRGGK